MSYGKDTASTRTSRNLHHMLNVLAARGRSTGRGRPSNSMMHAVPGNDRTHSAVCGAPVDGATQAWPDAAGSAAELSRFMREAGACAECAALLAPDAV